MSGKKKALVLCKSVACKHSWTVFSLCHRTENLNIHYMRFKFSGSTFWVFGYRVPTC